MILPLVTEYYQKKRKEDESAVAYVKRRQEEQLKTAEALLNDTGQELTTIRTLQLAVVAELLRRVRDARSASSSGNTSLPPS